MTSAIAVQGESVISSDCPPSVPERHVSGPHAFQFGDTPSGQLQYIVPPQLQDTEYLLLLFRALGGSEIPKLLFERGKSPQPRWNDGGFDVHVIPHEGGLDQQLVDIL
jgi:hypothetical protein